MPISFSPPANRELRSRGAGVTAVLGPTNTGKTHLGIERMLAHSSGLIGLPLRLLAREVYNRAVERVGADEVALVTGEEKIKPANPRFWVATVEAMPRDLDVAFLAIDEIQLAADFERGHVFTDRMLHRRGREETLVLGAATMRPIVERLLPGASIVSRPRLSQLTFAGEKKLTRLPRRSAIVAFSAEEVYAIAAAPPSCSARCRRARAMRRSSSISRARSITWSRPTPSAWGSISTSITSPLLPIANSTAISSASSTPRSLPRSPAAPGAPCATARSERAAAVRHSRPNWFRRWKATPLSR